MILRYYQLCHKEVVLTMMNQSSWFKLDSFTWLQGIINELQRMEMILFYIVGISIYKANGRSNSSVEFIIDGDIYSDYLSRVSIDL